MARGKASGISLSKKDAEIVLGMEARGDRSHDIAAWFGVNQGRIAEVKDGSYGPLTTAAPEMLPPKGPPGLKGRRLRATASQVLQALQANDVPAATKLLQNAIAKYDAHEA